MNNQNDPNQRQGQSQDQQGQQRLQEQQQQRQGGGKFDLGQVREHMEVVGSDGAKVGTVDKVEGDQIKLTKGSSGGGGQHRYIDASSVAEIKGDKVCLSVKGDSSLGGG